MRRPVFEIWYSFFNNETINVKNGLLHAQTVEVKLNQLYEQ